MSRDSCESVAAVEFVLSLVLLSLASRVSIVNEEKPRLRDWERQDLCRGAWREDVCVISDGPSSASSRRIPPPTPPTPGTCAARKKCASVIGGTISVSREIIRSFDWIRSSGRLLRDRLFRQDSAGCCSIINWIPRLIIADGTLLISLLIKPITISRRDIWDLLVHRCDHRR